MRLVSLRTRAHNRPHSRLERDLRDALRGDVQFDVGSRALYSTDASNYRQPPIGVVRPRDAGDVKATFEVCRAHGVPVLSRAGGTSLAGQCCNDAVVLDFSRYMRRVLEVDASGRSARVDPGTVLDHLRDTAKPHGLTFGPDPGTHNRCTLGGMIGNNSCGAHAVMAECRHREMLRNHRPTSRTALQRPLRTPALDHGREGSSRLEMRSV
jgi:FAD/FMN-containing dehydrogenase